MKPEDFTADVAERVMGLWAEHLGFWRKSNRYSENPRLLANLLQNPNGWLAGMFQDRIGSRFTDDSKLYASLTKGKLELRCYVQAHTAVREEEQEALDAENTFNSEVMSYLTSV